MACYISKRRKANQLTAPAYQSGGDYLIHVKVANGASKQLGRGNGTEIREG